MFALTAGLYVLMCAFTPIGIGADMRHDDAMFILNARYFAAGHWFGPYNQFTLAKGPGYPVFLALSSWSGLPITISQALFNCFAVAALCYVIARMSGSRALALATFIIVLWNPGMLCFKILRQAINPGQVLLFTATFSYVLFCEVKTRRVIAWSCIAGVILGWLWLTREECFWVLSGAAVLAMGAGLCAWATERSIRRPMIATAGAIASFLFVLLAYEVGNLVVYGSMVRVDTRERNFVGAMSALQEVRVGNPISRVPVTAEARRTIYQVSPAFASLAPHLDPSGVTTVWEAIACRKYSWTCGEISGASFQWALRDAAAATGHYQSPARAMEFFRQLRDEVRSACRQGKLECVPSRMPMVPSFHLQQAERMPAALAQAFSFLLFTRPPPLMDSASSGTPGDFAEALRLLNYPFYRHLEASAQSGVFSAPQQSQLGKPLKDLMPLAAPSACRGYFDAVSFDVVSGAKVFGWAWDLNQKRTPDQIILADSNGRVVGFAAIGVERPDLVTAGIGITASNAGWQGYAVAGKSVSAYAVVENGREACRLGGMLDIEAPPSARDSDPRVRWARGFRAGLIAVYSFLMPALLGAGLLAMLFNLGMVTRSCAKGDWRAAADPMLMLAAASWVLLFSIVLLLCVIEVALFDVINHSYLAPAYPLACLAPLLSLWAAIRQVQFDK